MNDLAEILEHELEQAVEVKNKQSLHRYVVLLAENIACKGDDEKSVIENRSEIKLSAEILEHELEQAVEVKNKESLHRHVVLLAENIVRKNDYEKSIIESRSEIQQLVETMKEGFKGVDKRFEDM